MLQVQQARHPVAKPHKIKDRQTRGSRSGEPKQHDRETVDSKTEDGFEDSGMDHEELSTVKSSLSSRASERLGKADGSQAPPVEHPLLPKLPPKPKRKKPCPATADPDADSDGDTVANKDDAFPMDPLEWHDLDK